MPARFLSLLLIFSLIAPAADTRDHRIAQVIRTKGLAAFWDFVKRTPDGRFDAYQPSSSKADYSLDAINYVLDYWNEGRPATYSDFPLLNRGPFGQAIQIRNETDRTFRPCLIIPRARIHNTPLDVKGPGQSVSMVVWLIRESGNHAIAGIWHEGTDMRDRDATIKRVERGKRQYAMFAGLAANDGAVAVHVSENGAASFGDRYARNLAVTPEKIPPTEWTVAGFVFDNARNTATAYINGKATEYWIDNPTNHPFFQWPAKAWPSTYNPPKAFTKLSPTGQLLALKANPFWFPHDLYAPTNPEDGGPFTIGRVIHTSRGVGFTGYIGGVAVFNRALSPKEMSRLARIAVPGPLTSPKAP